MSDCCEVARSARCARLDLELVAAAQDLRLWIIAWITVISKERKVMLQDRQVLIMLQRDNDERASESCQEECCIR